LASVLSMCLDLHVCYMFMACSGMARPAMIPVLWVYSATQIACSL